MSDRKLECVDLVLEPVESYRIDAKDISRLTLENVHRDYHYDSTNGFDDYLRCDEAVIDIKLETMQKIETTQELDGKPARLDARLDEWNDLVGLDLYFSDGSHEYIYVPWTETDDDPDDNAFMSSAVTRSFMGGDVVDVYSILVSRQYRLSNGKDGETEQDIDDSQDNDAGAQD